MAGFAHVVHLNDEVHPRLRNNSGAQYQQTDTRKPHLDGCVSFANGVRSATWDTQDRQSGRCAKRRTFPFGNWPDSRTSTRYLSQVERGLRDPSPRFLKAVTDALGKHLAGAA